MNAQAIELLVLAIVAGVVLAKLYSSLGRRTGAERPPAPAPQPAQGEFREALADRANAGAVPGGPASGGLAELMRADPGFDSAHFMAGARGAYELIVTSFANGDKDQLRSLLTPRVFDAYSKAIEERAPGAKGSELVRLKTAEFVDARLEDHIARVSVRFEAELAEGATGLRDTKEKWTFERDVRSADPNWKLARVTAA